MNTYEYDNYLEITDIDYSMTQTKKTGTFEFRNRVLRSYVDNNDWFWGDTEYSDENIDPGQERACGDQDRHGLSARAALLEGGRGHAPARGVRRRHPLF